MLAFASLLMLTSCKQDAPGNDSGDKGDKDQKYLVKEIISDGETTKIEYDSQNRVTKVIYKNVDSSGNFEAVYIYSYEGNRVKITHNGKVTKGIVERGLVFCPSVASEKELPASHADRDDRYYIEGSAKFNSEGKLTSLDGFAYDYKNNTFKKETTHLTWKDGNLIDVSSEDERGALSFEYSNTPNPTNCFDFGLMNAVPRSTSATMHSKNLPKKVFSGGDDSSLTFEVDKLGRPISCKEQGKDYSHSITYRY